MSAIHNLLFDGVPKFVRQRQESDAAHNQGGFTGKSLDGAGLGLGVRKRVSVSCLNRAFEMGDAFFLCESLLSPNATQGMPSLLIDDHQCSRFSVVVQNIRSNLFDNEYRVETIKFFLMLQNDIDARFKPHSPKTNLSRIVSVFFHCPIFQLEGLKSLSLSKRGTFSHY